VAKVFDDLLLQVLRLVKVSSMPILEFHFFARAAKSALLKVLIHSLTHFMGQSLVLYVIIHNTVRLCYIFVIIQNWAFPAEKITLKSIIIAWKYCQAQKCLQGDPKPFQQSFYKKISLMLIN